MDKRQKAIYVLFHSAKLVLCQDSLRKEKQECLSGWVEVWWWVAASCAGQSGVAAAGGASAGGEVARLLLLGEVA